jgi:hypothetical protein
MTLSLIPSFQACSIAYFGVSAGAGAASVVSSTLAGVSVVMFSSFY